MVASELTVSRRGLLLLGVILGCGFVVSLRAANSNGLNSLNPKSKLKNLKLFSTGRGTKMDLRSPSDNTQFVIATGEVCRENDLHDAQRASQSR